MLARISFASAGSAPCVAATPCAAFIAVLSFFRSSRRAKLSVLGSYWKRRGSSERCAFNTSLRLGSVGRGEPRYSRTQRPHCAIHEAQGDFRAATISVAPIEPNRVSKCLGSFVVMPFTHTGKRITVPERWVFSSSERRLPKKEHLLTMTTALSRYARLTERRLHCLCFYGTAHDTKPPLQR
jgi:hypothetical protein